MTEEELQQLRDNAVSIGRYKLVGQNLQLAESCLKDAQKENKKNFFKYIEKARQHIDDAEQIWNQM